MSVRAYNVTVKIPGYDGICNVLWALEGQQDDKRRRLQRAVTSHPGEDFSDPDTWIDKLLTGDEAVLAHHIWKQSQEKCNPRYAFEGFDNFVLCSDLMRVDTTGRLQITSRGYAFLNKDSSVLWDFETATGLIEVLRITSKQGPVKPSDPPLEWRAVSVHYPDRAGRSDSGGLRRNAAPPAAISKSSSSLEYPAGVRGRCGFRDSYPWLLSPLRPKLQR